MQNNEAASTPGSFTFVDRLSREGYSSKQVALEKNISSQYILGIKYGQGQHQRKLQPVFVVHRLVSPVVQIENLLPLRKPGGRK